MSAPVTVHECEAFNEKDKGGNPIKGTFDIARYDGQFPGKGVPVAQVYDKKTRTWSGTNICTFCGKDVTKSDKANKEQLAYIGGKSSQ